MDVNSTRFHLVQGARNWRHLLDAEPDAGLWWDQEHGSLGLASQLLRFPRRRSETPPALEQRRGAGCDRYGNIYWIGPDNRSIRILPGGTRTAGPFWSVTDLGDRCDLDPDREFAACAPEDALPQPSLRGLAVTTHRWLVVGTIGPAGLLVFDLHAGGPPVWLPWPDEVPFAPFDMAPADDGGVWILDRGPLAGETRFWRLDRFFRVVPTPGAATVPTAPASTDDFEPVGGLPRQIGERRSPLGTLLGDGSPVDGSAAIAILGLPDGTTLILESDAASPRSVIRRYRDDRMLSAIELGGDLLGELLDARERNLRGYDFAFVPAAAVVPGTVGGDLYVLDDTGNQAFVFALLAEGDALTLDLRPRYLPVQGFTGKALVRAGDAVLYDLDERWLPLTEQPRRRYQTAATLAGLVFDGKRPDCVWHRVIQDACIGPGDAITIESRAANQLDLLAESPWTREPDPYLRADGSELPYHRPFTADELEHAGTGSWELLFQHAVGRYLELRLTLRGSGRTTPRLRSLRVWYPRFSYLHEYLPAVYRESPPSASFLDRFLANPEGLFTALEGRIAEAQTLFDVRTAPADYLCWLAGWLGALLDPDWDDARRRLFLAHAELLFRWRGTPAGVLAMIRLAVDLCPDTTLLDGLATGRVPAIANPGGNTVRIVEDFLTRQVSGVVIGDPRTLDQPVVTASDEPYQPAQGPEPLHQRFRSFLRALYDGGESEEAALTRLNAAWEADFGAFTEIRFPPVLPVDGTRAADWRAFTERGLGFTYAAVTTSDLPLYQDFLRRRYRRIADLNQAYALVGERALADFEDIRLPEQLPDQRVWLADWIGFVSLALPIQRHAHRFTVLVPTVPEESAAAQALRVARVRAVVEREKPAHTQFDVHLFWALFQVGGARLGLDTILGEGSRYVAVVLGSGYLGTGFLAESHPWAVRDRTIVGRDPLTESRTHE